jgi:hypothetical protein
MYTRILFFHTHTHSSTWREEEIRKEEKDMTRMIYHRRVYVTSAAADSGWALLQKWYVTTAGQQHTPIITLDRFPRYPA